MSITPISVALVVCLVVFSGNNVSALNERPVIGLLFQESRSNDTHGDTYLEQAYVDYIQSAGAMAVPIRVKQNDDYYKELFSKINGLLLPGGAVSLFTSEYAKAGVKLITMAIEANKKGDYFPVWGTCLGSELLMIVVAQEVMVYEKCNAEDIMMPLHLLPDAKNSRMLKDISEEDMYVLTNYNVTANYHIECLTPKAYKKNKNVNSFYKAVSVNYDSNGVEFISMFEAYKYPIYGSQWHPEKNIFIWAPDHHLNHSFGAVKVAQYFANFFVNEARKSGHRYPDNRTLSKEIFYNYQPVYLGLPSMLNNYYINFTDSNTFDFLGLDSKYADYDIISIWYKDNKSASYLLLSILVFFLMGISFVFVMDCIITVSGKMFSITKDTAVLKTCDEVMQNNQVFTKTYVSYNPYHHDDKTGDFDLIKVPLIDNKLIDI